MISNAFRTAALPGALLAMLAVPASAAGPKVYDTPEQAVDDLLGQLKAGQRDAIVEIFGEGSEDVLLTGEDAVDRETWAEFYNAATAVRRITENVDGTATLYVGEEQWPVPIPIAKTDAGWAFDVEAGREEILVRRIGENELNVIAVAEAYVSGQLEYRLDDHDGDGVHEFAEHFVSAPGEQDGLYWPAEEDEPLSPFGPLVASASAEGYVVDGRPEEPEPYHGYFYRILTKQGENAPGGAYDYMVGGNMVAGHAMLAFPAAYGVSGVMSFIVSENGIVLEADLGEETGEIADAIEAYDPDDRWAPVEEE